MRESEVEQELKKLVKEHGGECYKWVSPGQRGVPDRIVIFPGFVSFVELKRPKGGVLSEHQKRIHIRFGELDYDVHVLSTKEQVQTWVQLTVSILQVAKGKA
jgi:hypothetical protein